MDTSPMTRSVALVLVVMLGSLGCASSPKNAQTAQAAEDRVDLTTFLHRLSQQGVTAVEHGPAGSEIGGAFGERLLLNNSDWADVYFFRDTSQAESAADLADASARYDLYQKDNVVLVHLVMRDPTVTSAFQDLLGLPR